MQNPILVLFTAIEDFPPFSQKETIKARVDKRFSLLPS